VNRCLVVAAALAVGVSGCATNPSPDARLANNLAQATVVVGAPLAVGVGFSRSYDANQRDADGRLVPVARQEGRQHVMEGAIIGGVTALVAGLWWGYMALEDAAWEAKQAPPPPPPASSPPDPWAVGDAPPAPDGALDEAVLDDRAGGVVIDG
jgi:hypothetical protein